MAQATSAIRNIKRDVPFKWEGRDRRGAKVSGRTVAASEQALRGELRRQGIAATRIKEQSAGAKRGG